MGSSEPRRGATDLPLHEEPWLGGAGELDAGGVVIEAERRLSDSLLWRLQRAYFEQAGVEAWRTTTVPHYVTNNPALAQAYARVLFGFLRDCHAPPGSPEPITLVELGAGTGRFAYLVLKRLTELLRRSPLAGVRFRYVLTDFAEANLAFFRAHPALQPFVAQGVLDFALFDVEHDRELRLLHAGETIGPGALRHPIGVVANYVFDGVPQDAFSFVDGGLEECLFTLSSDAPEPDLGDPSLIGRLKIEVTRRPAPLDYYEEPRLNAVLRRYAAGPARETVLFPSSALRCVRRLADLAGGRLFLLSGDRGEAHGERVSAVTPADMAIHGSFSLPVNYHAIAEYVTLSGGAALTTPHRHAHLNVTASLLGDHPSAYVETKLAYELAITRAGPDDFFALRRAIQHGYEQLEIAPLLALIRMSHDDPRILHDCLPALWARAEGAPPEARRDVVQILRDVWENHYPLGEERDLAFDFGVVAYAYEGHEEALRLFQASLRLYGDDPRTRWNMGLCHLALGEAQEALRCFAEAIACDASFRPRALQHKQPTPWAMTVQL